MVSPIVCWSIRWSIAVRVRRRIRILILSLDSRFPTRSGPARRSSIRQHPFLSSLFATSTTTAITTDPSLLASRTTSSTDSKLLRSSRHFCLTRSRTIHRCRRRTCRQAMSGTLTRFLCRFLSKHMRGSAETTRIKGVLEACSESPSVATATLVAVRPSDFDE